MGLDTFASGLSHDDNFHGSYGLYSSFIEELIRQAYGEKCREIRRRAVCDGFCDGKYMGALTDDDIRTWTENHNEDLDILIFHSDKDGKFTPEECRRIYSAIQDIHFDLDENTYSGRRLMECLEQFKKIFKYCRDKRVNLYYK